jgi:alpha/beta superfamily hydrolase
METSSSSSAKPSLASYGKALIRNLSYAFRGNPQWRFLGAEKRRDSLKPRSQSHRVRPVVLRSKDGTRLSGWLMTPRWPEAKGAVLYFSNGSEEALWLAAQAQAMFPDMTVLVMHYRSGPGRGKQPAAEDLVTDGETLYDWLADSHRHLTPFPIVVMGRDFGAGIAVKVAASRPATALALLAPCDVPLPEKRFSLLHRRGRADSQTFLFKRATPILVVRAQSDEIVPPERTDAFVARLPPKILERTIAGADYYDLPYRQELHAAIAGFLREHVAATAISIRHGTAAANREPVTNLVLVA